MRLIDADKLLEETRKDRDYAEKNGFLDMYYERQVLIDRIESQPTAYDVDKVVEELEEAKGNVPVNRLLDDIIKEKPKELGQLIAYDKAIEIVKQGDVSDDVCEWKVFDNSLTDEPQWVYGTTCGKYIGEEHTSKAFAYCPYCGKKIKVVE